MSNPIMLAHNLNLTECEPGKPEISFPGGGGGGVKKSLILDLEDF